MQGQGTQPMPVSEWHRLVEQVGWTIATKLTGGQVPNEALATATVNDLLAVCSALPTGSALEARALEQALKRAQTFKECLDVCTAIPLDGPLWARALEQALACAQTTAEYLDISTAIPIHSLLKARALKEQALEQAFAHAQTLEECLDIYGETLSGSLLQEQALEQAFERAETLPIGGLVKIFNAVETGSDAQRRVLEAIRARVSPLASKAQA